MGYGMTLAQKKRRRRNNLTAYAFMSPWFIGFGLFSAFPILYMFVISLTNRKLVGISRYIGFKNYINMFKSATVMNSLKVTIIITLGMMVITTIWALLTAMLLNRKQIGNKAFQFFYFIPAVIPTVALAYAFRMVLGNDTGILNYLLSQLTGQRIVINWLLDVKTVYPSVFWVTLYTYGTGQMMLIFLSGLKDVPQELYEACDIDGATPWRKFVSVTLPIISPVLLFNMVMGSISALNGSFALLYPLTAGDPNGMTNVLSLAIYKEAFLNYKVGYGAGISVLLFMIACFLAAILFRLSKKFVYYEV
ncbi:MAG: sugar ABC transporter permease [Eubacteriales bacterium]|nr:sugar ABC transporter permease [Eubacteriales bacterium]